MQCILFQPVRTKRMGEGGGEGVDMQCKLFEARPFITEILGNGNNKKGRCEKYFSFLFHF